VKVSITACLSTRHQHAVTTPVVLIIKLEHKAVGIRAVVCISHLAAGFLFTAGTDKLQCVLNAAARLLTGTRKFDHGLSHLLALEDLVYRVVLVVHSRLVVQVFPEFQDVLEVHACRNRLSTTPHNTCHTERTTRATVLD